VSSLAALEWFLFNTIAFEVDHIVFKDYKVCGLI